MPKISLSFHGGAREVTGACYLLEAGSKKLLVDCGMFQDGDNGDERNREPFAFDAAGIEAVFLTHAHIDHIGRLPKLFREGFRGTIYSTPPTRDLAKILLEDALGLARKGEAEPFFSEDDIAGAMKLFHAVEYGEDIILGEEITAKLLPAGHILGSAFIRVTIGGKVFLFSGDVGNDPSTLLPPRASVPEVNILVVESTYGNRRHKTIRDRGLALERAIEDITSRKGTLMLPVFATERTQEILFEINELVQKKRVPAIPVFLDSPLAERATEVFSRYTSYYRDEVQRLCREHRHLFQFKNLKFAMSVEESKTINDVPPPKVILAGSGMSSGGRIIHHERRYLPDPNSILLITGYQSAGSLGRRLLDHEREVKIHDEAVPVRAEVRVIDGYSAHADQEELLQFVDEMRENLERVFVVQGEPDAAFSLEHLIQDKFGIAASAPVYGERFEL